MTNENPDLVFPISDPPEYGTTKEVAPGVYWLQMPLPMSLDHINLYLLADHDGWTVVDTGMRGDDTHQLWWEIINDQLEGRPIKRIVCTHMHPDHTGQAGFLSEHFQAPLWMSYAEFYQARAMTSMMMGPGSSWQMNEYFQRTGYDVKMMEGMRQGRGPWTPPTDDRPFPGSFYRLTEGASIAIGDRVWQVIIGTGHSPEHVCLYCEDLRVMISGDQVLPIITSNVSVHPTEPEANPLLGFMDSCRKLKAMLPDDILVLPAHNLPFYGIQTRLQQLLDHHDDRMLALEEFCVTPQIAIDMLPILFKRDLDGHSRFMALGEAIAHLHCLMHFGRIERTLKNEVYHYLSIDPTLPERARPGQHEEPDDRPMMV